MNKYDKGIVAVLVGQELGDGDVFARPRFEAELRELINKNSIENFTDMPDFLLAKMICRFIEAVGPSIKDTLDWHGCNSVCHPASAPNKEAAQ